MFTVCIVVICYDSTVFCVGFHFIRTGFDVRDKCEKTYLSMFICGLISECPAFGPDLVLEFPSWVGGRGAQGAKWVGVYQKFGKHSAQHSDRRSSVHDVCMLKTVMPNVKAFQS